jgi:hypothetical protein
MQIVTCSSSLMEATVPCNLIRKVKYEAAPDTVGNEVVQYFFHLLRTWAYVGRYRMDYKQTRYEGMNWI